MWLQADHHLQYSIQALDLACTLCVTSWQQLSVKRVCWILQTAPAGLGLWLTVMLHKLHTTGVLNHSWHM
jgi:hypothetical protein